MELKINNNKKTPNQLHLCLSASLEERMRGGQGDGTPKPGRHSSLSLSHTHTHTHTCTHAHGLRAHTHTHSASQVTRTHVRAHTPPPGGTCGKAPACQCRRQQMQVRSLGRKIPWRRAWQPTLEFLAGESHGQRSLVGYSPWGHKESDTTQVT